MPHDWTFTTTTWQNGETMYLWRCTNCKSQWTSKFKPDRDMLLSFADHKLVSCEEVQDIMAVQLVHES
jgi:hypothetical protein